MKAAQAADPAAVARFLAEERLPAAYADVIDRIYAPIARSAAALRADRADCLVLGLSGPQGSGKSTGAMALRMLIEAQGWRTAALSLDDLYLTRTERRALAASVHPLLATRGPPGTHDVALGVGLIDAIRQRRRVRLPLFDKAIDDRRPEGDGPLADPPVDILIFEGWCLGARPQPAADLEHPINALEAEEDRDGIWRRHVNTALDAYAPLFARIDYLAYLRPPSFAVVAGWRREQEDKLRARIGGEAGARLMSPAQIDCFVQHYERVTRHMIDDLSPRADALVELDEERRPILVRL